MLSSSPKHEFDEMGLTFLLDRRRLPRHIAIILDGNGRWAATYDLPRILGHRQGAKSVREIVVLSRELGIEVLSLYAFSSENWSRPKREVTQLMALLSRYLENELRTMMKNGVRLRTVGQIERLPAPVVRLIRDVEAQTAENRGMTLVLALSYGGRAEIVDAAKRLAEGVRKGEIALEEISEAQFAGYLYAPDLPDPDLLIRTSGEVRVSNFFLWQMAYTEFYFTDTLWPNFGRRDFLAALLDYQGRERRFGRVSGTRVRPRADEKIS
jgi:undecaprenyl diphosphate synthase